MRESDVGAIPVKSGAKLVGIVTDRDITCRGLANSGDRAKMTAKDVMTGGVASCSPEDDVSSAIQTMEPRQIRRLPVIDRDKALIGMLTLGDISHKVGKTMSGELLRAVSGHHL